MKTKVDKKGKKRSLSETSLPAKSDQKPKYAVKSKNSPKKPKLADTARNGKLAYKTKERALKKIAGPLEKQARRAKQENSAAKSSKQEMKTHAKGETKLETKLELLKQKQARRALTKEKRKQKVYTDLSVEQMKSRIEAIRGREVLTKTAKKKLAILKRKLKAMGFPLEEDAVEQNEKKVASQKESGKMVKNKNKKAAGSPNDQKKKDGEKGLVLYVQNLPADITEDEIKELFLTKVDTVTNIKIKSNRKTSAASAFVELSSRADCVKGLSLSDTLVEGKKITVQYSLSPPAFGDTAKLGVQKQKLQSKKAKNEPEEDDSDLIEDEGDDDEDESDMEEEEAEFMDMNDSEEESDDDEDDDDEKVAHGKESNKKMKTKKEAARPLTVAAVKKLKGKFVGGVQKGKDQRKKGSKMVGQKRNKIGRNY
ncbi:DNA ligase 1 [Ooceraea biroi]|uniref:RRM domain-containing protein n=1 Tax=Ooceraea biroi TaxID=2015173 RepID=A0A026WRA7_OOCBI|nr:DNA ligase 1 [Ooceraea biroi]EZA57604.1 hypothetical protein X777_02144 [Ooceraea biroi]